LSSSLDDISKLKWRCRRGTKELDFLLEAYLMKHYAKANNDEQSLFVELLTFQDSQLIVYLLGDKKSESREINLLVKKIRDY